MSEAKKAIAAMLDEMGELVRIEASGDTGEDYDPSGLDRRTQCIERMSDAVEALAKIIDGKQNKAKP